MDTKSAGLRRLTQVIVASQCELECGVVLAARRFVVPLAIIAAIIVAVTLLARDAKLRLPVVGAANLTFPAGKFALRAKTAFVRFTLLV